MRSKIGKYPCSGKHLKTTGLSTMGYLLSEKQLLLMKKAEKKFLLSSMVGCVNNRVLYFGACLDANIASLRTGFR